MNAPLPVAVTAATLVEIAQALGVTKQAVAQRAGREEWAFDETATRGGKQRLYPLASLPKDVSAAVKHRRQVGVMASRGARMKRLTEVLARFEEAEEAAAERRAEQAEAQLKGLAGGLTDREALTLQAHCAIAAGWQVWFVKADPPLRRSASWAAYAQAYNLAEIPVAKAVREACEKISGRSVQRWVYEYEKQNLAALVDRRNGAKLAGKTVFNALPLLAAAATKMLLDKPGIRTQQLVNLLRTAATDEATGETLFAPPSYGQVWRFQQTWIANHRDLYLQATDPDAWKNQTMLAFGSRSEEVSELNGRWEMDATPADWLLLDEDGKKRRYTVSVIVDVWSRRLMVVVARTPKSVTHCLALRAALLAWGVPKEIVTDNGQDYQSEHFKRVLLALGITHLTTNPFSPEEKPHVERAIKTLNHSILELLPAFAGHSVADRQAIEAREAFATRLAKRGEVVDWAEAGALTGAALQGTIQQWLSGVYEQRTHASLGLSPFAKAASWAGEVRRIRDERSLDLLLARPAGGGQRTLQKKGIALDNTWFIAPELATIDMGSVLDIYETPDLGRVIVYYRKNFLCIAQAPERTGVDRHTIAEQATALQKERMRTQKAQIKALTKRAPATDELLKRHLAESAAAAGKLVMAPFGARTHESDGLREAAKAAAALAAPKPSSRAAELSAQARAAMAELPANVTPHPAAKAHATPLEGMSAAEKYAYWQELQALVQAAGGDGEVLEQAWQRRFYAGFPQSSFFSAQESLAKAQKETRGG